MESKKTAARRKRWREGGKGERRDLQEACLEMKFDKSHVQQAVGGSRLGRRTQSRVFKKLELPVVEHGVPKERAVFVLFGILLSRGGVGGKRIGRD